VLPTYSGKECKDETENFDKQASPHFYVLTIKPVNVCYHHRRPPPKALESAQMTIPTTATTRITPVHTPVLKIPPIASQLVKVNVRRRMTRQLINAFIGRTNLGLTFLNVYSKKSFHV
jgi:hypothetical protein